MVLAFSGHANTSPQIRREVERAVNKGIPIIPLRIEDVQPSRALEYFISTPHWLDAFTPPLERHLNRLAQAIQIIFDRAVNQPPPSPDPSPPIPDPPPMAPAQPAGFGTTGKDTSSNAQAATTAEVVADDGRGEPGWAIFCLAGGGLFTYTGVMLLIGDLQNPRPVPLAGYLIAVGLLIGGLLCAAYGGKKLRDAWLKQRRRMG
jgi:hypothetical protein